jgi:CheY-like chemotaxis protein
MTDMTDCILLAADKAKTLVQQLLSFSRKQILDMRPLDLNNVIASFYEILRRTIPENIDIRLELVPERCGIRADRNQIEQVLMNLAVNARDAIEGNGAIMIETAGVVLDEEYARLHAGARPGRYALLAFSDTGCGMDEETAKRIFEPFFTTKDVGQGSGLGLSTVYGLIKQHGGYIRVYSEPGRGTTFRMYFPLIDAREPGEPSAGSGAISVNGEGRAVLLVEDNDMVRSMVKALLLSYGFEVHVARDPRQALQLAAGTEFDLLVSDVVMPEMTGPELLEHLLTTQPLLKALFMSGYTASMAARHGMNRTGVKFIQKPFAIHDFLHTIDSMLDQD